MQPIDRRAHFMQTNTQLLALLDGVVPDEARALIDLVALPACGLKPRRGTVSRAELALALTLALFAQLVDAVPEATRYVERVRSRGESMTFDHGAVRTVLAGPFGALPPGQSAITRILLPLGYTLAGTYPLPRLNMTGRAYIHADDPHGIAQFFLSELHADQFSTDFHATVSALLGNSHDPLTTQSLAMLDALQQGESLPLDAAQELLPQLLRCFARQHPLPSVAQYDVLAAESAEMAWISTEGQTFNHATDRVSDVESLAASLRAEGYAIKDAVEVSAEGTVRQTALRAATVERALPQGQNVQRLELPGSFFEFISRDAIPGGLLPADMDMRFDSGNATGIFKMTAI